jgi:VWFA-related protein
MNRWRKMFAVALCLVAFLSTTTAQTDDEIVRVETDLVTVEARVTDGDGKIVNNLRPEDFKLFEDGVELPVSFFSLAQRERQPRPVAVVFALDVSGSVTGEELAQLRKAVNAFAGRLADGSSLFAVMSFGTHVKTLQSLTSDAAKLSKALDKLAADRKGLSTHAYDAVDDAVRLLVKKAPRTRERRLLKRAVVVVSDGFPVGDTVAPATVIERANASDVSIYTVVLPSFSRLMAARERKPLPTPLDVSGLAEKTGGVGVYADAPDFEPLFRSLAEEVSATYLLSFYPVPDKRRDGRFHTLRVEVPRGYYVRQSRPGYQAR